jgi:hypothetical protein
VKIPQLKLRSGKFDNNSDEDDDNNNIHNTTLFEILI